MIIQRISSDSQELVFTVVKAVAGVTLSAGATVIFDFTTLDGVRVTIPSTAGLSAVVGITIESINDQTKGRVRVYGYQSQAWVTNNQTTAIAPGDMLIPVNAATYLAWGVTAGDGLRGKFISGDTYATATAGAVTVALKKVLVYCL